MGNSNPYIRKKACLCAVRIIRKCPDVVDDFINPSLECLNDKNHSVLLSAITLIIELIKVDAKYLKKYRAVCP
jgi:AP-1 complex subunit gamma-1